MPLLLWNKYDGTKVITYLNDEINKWQLGMRVNVEPAGSEQVFFSSASGGGGNTGMVASRSSSAVTPLSTAVDDTAARGGSASSQYHQQYHYGASSAMSTAAAVSSSSSAVLHRVTPPSYVSNSSSNIAQQRPLDERFGAQGSSSDDSLLMSLGLGPNLEHVYMKGLKNLGLDSEVIPADLAASLKLAHGSQGYESYSGNHHTQSYKQTVAAVGSTFAASDGIPLDAMDYYAITPPPAGSSGGKTMRSSTAADSQGGGMGSPPHKSTRQQREGQHLQIYNRGDGSAAAHLPMSSYQSGGGGSGDIYGRQPSKQKYDWQAPNFGLETSLEHA